MARDVTSWFISTANDDTISPVRKFTIGSSDYSDRVVRWPKFKLAWNDIRPKSINITLANEDRALNFYRTNKTRLTTSYTLQYGLTHPTSGDELITVFSGKGKTVSYKNGAIDITIVDKFQQLADRTIGTSDVPISYTGSNYLPSDLAWWAITSYGGYNTTQDSSNPDINYASFAEWAEVFSSNAVFFNAHFDGQKVTEVLRKIGRQTYSAIYVEDDKLNFHRFTLIDSNTTPFNNDNISDLQFEIIVDNVVNRQKVSFAYDVDSEYFQYTVVDASTSSINSYGLKEDIEEDENVWHVNTNSALDLAQRRINVNGEPYESITIETGLSGMHRYIGETSTVVDSFMSLNEAFRIMEMEYDMNNGKMRIMADRTQVFGAFILDTSTLNSTAVLT